VAVSNGNADIQRVGLGRYFRAALSAREFGAAKPEARFFHAAAQAAGVAAADVLHVGDDAHLDVVGGLDAGMQVAWVNREAQDWPAQHPAHTPHATVADLGALVRLLKLQA
jgi:putative hydrolase of the HAD superfamily